MQPQYVGNNDFRGYLAYLNSQGDGMASNALQFTGNDGGIDEGVLRQYSAGPSGNPADDQAGYNKYSQYVNDRYNEWTQNKTLGATTGGSRLGGGGSTGGGTDVDRTAIQNQINNLNALLGVTQAQRDTGAQGIDRDYNEKKARLGEQRNKALVGYQDQETEALAGRTRGYEQVDNYADQSARSLNSIFQGANAGNSSVARLLAPSLVGKAADSRRLDVTTTANQNLGGIKKARDEAESEFNYADQDLENNRGYAKENFEKGIVQDEFDKYSQIRSLQEQGGMDYTDTQNKLNERTQRLSQLFGASKFNPNYSVREVAPKAVALNDYKVDPVAIQAGQNPQGGSSYYNPLLRKKQELSAR